MSANEIAERFAAACWVQLGSAGGEGINALSPNELRYRSLFGFQQRILTTTDASALPLFILPLDRVLSRVETAVYANRVGTVGPDLAGLSRLAYPYIPAPIEDAPNILVQPIKLSWLGPDLSNPTFMPFGLTPGPISVPADEDMNLYDAVAVLLPTEADIGLSGDVCVFIVKHPKLEAADEPLDEALPAQDPDPIAAMDPFVWWRMDDYTTGEDESGLTVVQFNARSATGLEGPLVLTTPVTAPLATDPIFNDQQVFSDRANALTPTSAPPGFWDFLASNQYTAYIIFAPRSGNTALQNVWISDTLPPLPPTPPHDNDDYYCLSDIDNDQISWGFPVAYGIDTASSYVIPFATAVDVAQLWRVAIDVAAGQQINVQSTSAGTDGGSFLTPPAGTAARPLFNNEVGGGLLSYAEIVMFNRVLTVDEESALVGIFIARYGAL